MAKDMQRAKYWKAVRAFIADGHGEQLPEVKDIQKWMDRVTTYVALTKRYPVLTRRAITVGDGRGMRYPQRPSPYMLCYPKAWRHQAEILWLVARMIDGNNPRREGTSHGWSMCAVYLDLIRYGMSKKEADAMKAKFVEFKVRWKKPVKRTAEPTEAQLQARRIFSVKRKLYAKPNAGLLSG